MPRKNKTVVLQTLDILSNALQFNRWLYSKFEPYIGKSVLEIGSGVGNITTLIDAPIVIATDYLDQFAQLLRHRFADDRRITVEVLDASSANDFNKIQAPIDTILCCNVLEHIENDRRVLENFHRQLIMQGRLLLLVPYAQLLYCGYDKELGHFKRYSKKNIRQIVEASGFAVERIFCFNLMGGLGWLFLGKLLRRRHLDTASIGLYEKLVPLFKLVEKIGAPFGASVICIARKI